MSLVALLGSQSFDHQALGHSSSGAGAFEAAAVYLAGHSSADDSLHIESLDSVESLHCVGCLLRQSRESLTIPRHVWAHGSNASPIAAAAGDTLPPEPTRFSGAPRGPPGVRSHSS